MTDASPAPPPSSLTQPELQAAFPEWSIWRSDGGHWYATRRDRLADRVRRYRLWTTVDASELDSLREQLQTQAERAELPLVLFGTLS